jgi:hypothetical protein
MEFVDALSIPAILIRQIKRKRLFTKRPPEHKLLFRWRIFVTVITIQAWATPPAFTE